MRVVIYFRQCPAARSILSGCARCRRSAGADVLRHCATGNSLVKCDGCSAEPHRRRIRRPRHRPVVREAERARHPVAPRAGEVIAPCLRMRPSGGPSDGLNDLFVVEQEAARLCRHCVECSVAPPDVSQCVGVRIRCQTPFFWRRALERQRGNQLLESSSGSPPGARFQVAASACGTATSPGTMKDTYGTRSGWGPTNR